MAGLATLVGLLMAAVGVAMVIAPDWLISLADWRTRAMMWAAAIGRVLLGVVFVRAAPDTTAPVAFQALGVLLVVAGVVIVFLPLSIWQSLVDSVLDQPAPFYRVAGAFATLFGLLIAYLA